LQTIINALENLLEQFDTAGAQPTIDVYGDSGAVVTARVTPETEAVIEEAYAALDAENNSDETV
jgi:hypothetical protein